MAVAIAFGLTWTLPAASAGASGGCRPAWPMYGHDARRTFSQPCERAISPSTVGRLLPDWFLHTNDSVTASPVVDGGTVYVGAWDGTFYAIDAADGAVRWTFTVPDRHTMAFGVITGSAAVTRIEGERVVLFPGGGSLYALDADDGRLRWSFDIDARHPTSTAEIESSPLVWRGVVYIGTDVHNAPGASGSGVMAFDVATGHRRWWFDPDRQARLGCGDVWASLALDAGRGLVYTGTGNCEDLEGWTRFTEAMFALRASDGHPVWSYQPHPPNRLDHDFGSTPNVFSVRGRPVVGQGNKDGAYYLLDRRNGAALWRAQVAAPGDVGDDFAVGGFIGSTAVSDGRIYGTTAIGGAPYLHAVDAATGVIAWQQRLAAPSYAAPTVANGVLFVGALDPTLRAYDAVTGDLLWLFPMVGPVSSSPAVVGGRLYVGAGTRSTDLEFKLLGGTVSPLSPMSGVYGFRLAA